tara:strand:- start:192 stop:374 length:183 start_codon:yes stop_codon:yes gene_type:complete
MTRFLFKFEHSCFKDNPMKKLMSALVVVLCWFASTAAYASTPTISEFTESMQPHQGFFNF